MSDEKGFWYKITIAHGPGHQSHHTFYKWSNHALDEDEKRDIFEDCCHGEYWDWPIGNVALLDRLPKDIRTSKIEEYKRRIETCRRMLEILQMGD